MTPFEQFLDRKKNEYGDRFDPSNLSKQFIFAFNDAPRSRVKVRFSHGEVVWGYVGVSAGWKPTFLLMRRLGQHGSCLTLSDKDGIVSHKFKR